MEEHLLCLLSSEVAIPILRLAVSLKYLEFSPATIVKSLKDLEFSSETLEFSPATIVKSLKDLEFSSETLAKAQN